MNSINHKVIKICFLIVMLVLNLLFSSSSIGQNKDCSDNRISISTGPGNADYSKIRYNCSEAIPTIVASDDEIDPEGTITLYVYSGGLACPPYEWEVSGTGYTIDSETNNDLETVTLTAPSTSGTCGVNYSVVAAVKVTDQCGETDEVKIRNTAGSWGTETVICNSGISGSYYYCTTVSGIYKYRMRRGFASCSELSWTDGCTGSTDNCLGEEHGSTIGCNAALPETIMLDCFNQVSGCRTKHDVCWSTEGPCYGRHGKGYYAYGVHTVWRSAWSCP